MDYNDIKEEVDKRTTILEFLRWARSWHMALCTGKLDDQGNHIFRASGKSDELLADEFLEIIDRKRDEADAATGELYMDFE